MTRVVTVSGHALVFSLKQVPDMLPRASMLIAHSDRVLAKYIELTGADVEAVLAVLLRIREKQREHEARVADERQEKLPLEVESKAPPATQTRTAGKRSKSTAK